MDDKYQLVFFSPEALLCVERWFDYDADTPSRMLVGDNCIPCP